MLGPQWSRRTLSVVQYPLQQHRVLGDALSDQQDEFGHLSPPHQGVIALEL